MKYLGWKKTVKNPQKGDENTLTEVYLFVNPEVVNYSQNKVFGVHPKNNNYKLWNVYSSPFSPDFIQEIKLDKMSAGILAGIGFSQNDFEEINDNYNMLLRELSKKIGIEEGCLERILR